VITSSLSTFLGLYCSIDLR